MKFSPVVPEICHGQVHGTQKERRKRRIIITIIRNEAKTISLPNMEQFCVFKIFEMSAIFKMAAKTQHKKWAVKNSTLYDIIKIYICG
jgi:hypothetical protein